MMLGGLDEAGGGCEEVGGRGQKLQSHYWPWICLWRPIAGLPLASSARQAVTSMEGQEDKGWNAVWVRIHVWVCASGQVRSKIITLNIHHSWLSLIMADKMVQISRPHYFGNTDVNNTWAKQTGAKHWLCVERTQLPRAYCRQRKKRSSWDYGICVILGQMKRSVNVWMTHRQANSSKCENLLLCMSAVSYINQVSIHQVGKAHPVHTVHCQSEDSQLD